MKIIVALTEIIALIVAIIQLMHEIVWIMCKGTIATEWRGYEDWWNNKNLF